MHLLQGLAPLHLTNHRVRRYLGDDLCLSVDDFASQDQKAIRNIYAFLQRLFAVLQDQSSGSRREAVISLLRERSVDQLVEETTRLGINTYAHRPSPILAKTIHDIRGGGLTPLLGQLQFLEMDREAEAVDALYFLTRDHLKIMRNALLQLDDEKREADLLPKAHSTRMLVEKHDGATLHGGGRSVRLTVECPEHVEISECCVEFGALDRILYNLLNNACRHTADDKLRLFLLPIPDVRESENLRLILVNSVSPQDAEHLRNLDLSTLFTDGVSTTGSGAGLAIVAQFVANAFGITHPEDAVARQYLGARLLDHEFLIYFHWPILPDY